MNIVSAGSQLKLGLAALVLFGVAAATGCTVDIGGQVHPNPYYLSDDVQYFPAGPEFKLSREAAALEAARAEVEGVNP